MPLKQQVMSPNRATTRARDNSCEDRKDDVMLCRNELEASSDDSAGDPSESSSSESAGSTHSSDNSDGDSSDCDDASSVSSNSSTSDRRSKKRKVSKKNSAVKKRRSKKQKRRSAELRDSPSVDVPKLTGADDYELWRTMIELKLKVLKLWELVVGQVREEDSWSSSKKRQWNSRWLKAQAVIAGSLGPRLAGRYRRLLVSCDPVMLFQEIEKEYNAGSAAKNDILIKAAMFVRKLEKGERVDMYIDAIMQFQEDLVTLGHPLEDPELARLLLTNALEVFPDLSNELVGARMKGTELEVGNIRGRLLAREQEENMRAPAVSKIAPASSSARGAQPETATVFQISNGQHGNDARGDHRRGGHRSHHHRYQNNRRESIQEGMQRRPCSNCGKLGHWHRDCTASSNRGLRGPPSHRGSRRHSGGKGGGRLGNSGPSALMAICTPTSVSKGIEWCLDNGAQINICNDLDEFVKIMTISDGPTMICASGTLVNINQVGSVELNITNEATGKQEKRVLSDVYYVPGAPANLLSQDYMQTRLKYFIEMPGDQSVCFARKQGTRIKFKKVDGLYRLWSSRNRSPQKAVVCNAIMKPKKSIPLTVWHKRFAHASDAVIQDMAKHKVVRGLCVDFSTVCGSSCLPCLHGKKVRMTYKERLSHADKPLQRLQVDVCTVNEPAVDGSTAFLLVVDEFGRYKWLFLLRQKSEAKQHLISLINRLHIKYRDRKWRVEEIHSDQGGEFDNSSILEFCDAQGIQLTTTNGYTPQENAIVERANGIVLPKVRSLLHMTNLPDLLWGEAALHVVYTVNVTATRVLGGITPHERLSGEQPDVSCLKTWGSLCYYHIASESRSKKRKLSSRMGTAVLVGYSPDTHGYKVIDLSNGTVSTHRGGNLVFAEDYTVGRDYVDLLLKNAYQCGDNTLPPRAPLVPMLMQINDVVKLDSVRESVLVQVEQSKQSNKLTETSMSNSKGESASGLKRTPGSKITIPTAPIPNSADGTGQKSTTRSGRKRKQPTRLGNFEVHHVARKWFKVMQCSLKSPEPGQLHSRDVPIPTTYKQVVRSKFAANWQAAMDEELESLHQHGVWQVVERMVAGTNAVITNKWVFAVKKDEHGFVKRFKARLVIHGFKQKFGVNYNETFAPVIRFETIRVAIYFAVQRGWAILQYDVKTAFLHGKLTETVYMELPQGQGSPGNRQICKLIKSLYGLKQAPHVWNKTLHRHLVALGFTRLESDHGLYSLHEKGEIIMLLTVYVDDLLLMGRSTHCDDIALKLATNFELVELGPVKYLLGVEVSIDREHNTVFFSQVSYIEEVLRRFHMHEYHGSSTPEATSAETVLDAGDADLPSSDLPYREIVGAFQYLVSGSRPDIAHVVRRLGQYMATFSAAHFAQAKRVLRYLQATKHFGLRMIVRRSAKVGLLRIEAYSDADYANDKIDRQSVSGYVTMLDGSVVSYGSRKQGLNAQSTMEAEYVAMNEGARDIMWLRGLCDELKWVFDLPALWCDNMAAIALSKKPGKFNGSKHVENRFHYVRNLQDRELLEVQHCGTDQMTADVLTKPLARVKFEHFRSLLGVVHREQIAGENITTTRQVNNEVVAWMIVEIKSNRGEGL